MLVNDPVCSNFKLKTNVFNNFFASKCFPVINSTTIPIFSYKIEQRIHDIEIIEEVIAHLLKYLNPIKGHGWDNFSFRKIQLCGKTSEKL